LDLAEAHPNGNELSVEIVGIQKESEHQRRTDHHDMEFQLAQQ
jgi:hypothetical protein